MEDDFEVYAEDNWTTELLKIVGTSKLPYFEESMKDMGTPNSSWEIFEDDDQVKVHLETDIGMRTLATNNYGSSFSKVENKQQVMYIRFIRKEGQHGLVSLLRELHNEKPHDITIIIHTIRNNLDEEELDALQAFKNCYKNFHVDFDDINVQDVLQSPEASSDEESDEGQLTRSSIFVSDDEDEKDEEGSEQPVDSSVDHDDNLYKDMLEMRKAIAELNHGDPRRLDFAEKFISEVFEKFK